MTVCSRRDCNKKLRKDNSKGECSSNCESPDAPPAQRAKGVEGRGLGNAPRPAEKEVTATATSHEATIQLFRTVTEAVGRDPDQMIAEYAQAWLDGLREKLQ